MNDSARPDSLRLFVAIELAEGVKDAIERAQDRLKNSVKSGKIRWARREQLHLTLKFLGNVAQLDLAGLTEALAGVCSQFAPITLVLEALGFFPDARSPRVVWVGVRAIQGELQELQKAVEDAVARFTAQENEKSFSGHVTVGRVKFLPGQEARMLGSLAGTMANEKLGEWTSSEAVLFASELLPDGSRYSKVAALPFGRLE